MKIESGTIDAPPLTSLEAASKIKFEAVSLYKVQKYADAGALFLKASSSVLIGHPNDLQAQSKEMAAACYSNASNAYLKAGMEEDAKTAAERCLEWSQDQGMEVKGRFRLAQALLSLASSSLPTSSTTSTYLSSAQNQLSIVLSIEPGNSQALNLAQEGLELSKRIIRTDKDGVHSKEVKEKARTDEEKLLQEAFNPTSDGTEVGAGEMGGSDYMADNWEAYQESLRKRKETEKAKDKGEEKKISSLPPSSPSAQNIPSTTNLVNSLKATKKKSQPPPPDIQETTAPVWDDMAASEASLTKNYNSVVEANSFVVSASEVMESLKTTESNYSDSWRNEHVKRRYNGKDRKHRVKKGGAAWEELEGTEKGAVKVVKELGDRKKKLSEKGGVGNTLEVKEGEEGGVKDWRKKLKMRRMGVEVKTKILEKKEKVKDVWEDMMGRENEEVERANKLKEERRKAERLAEKKQRTDKLKKKTTKAKKAKAKSSVNEIISDLKGAGLEDDGDDDGM